MSELFKQIYSCYTLISFKQQVSDLFMPVYFIRTFFQKFSTRRKPQANSNLFILWKLQIHNRLNLTTSTFNILTSLFKIVSFFPNYRTRYCHFDLKRFGKCIFLNENVSNPKINQL